MRERFEPRQTEKTARAFDGVNETEDIVEDLGVVGILFETHKLDVDHVETFIRLGDKFPQQVVHKKRLRRRASARLPLSVGSRASVSMKRLILVEYYRHCARVNRSLTGGKPDGRRDYCAATTTASPSIAIVALRPQALARSAA